MNIKQSILVSAFALMSFCAGAQSFQTGYFLDNYVYAYRSNPALHDEEVKTVFGLGIGDINVGVGSNASLTSFLFPKNGQLLFGLNDQVSSEEFLGGLPDLTKFNAAIDMSLLSVGVKTKNGGFFTFDARIRSLDNFALCKEFFQSLKDDFGTSLGSTFNVPEITIHSSNFLETALAYSWRMGGLRIGIGAKALFGLGNVDVIAKDLSLTVSEPYKVLLNGSVDASSSCKLLDIDSNDLSNINFGKAGVSGFGWAVDFGFLWNTPVDGLSASFAVTNLGQFKWTGDLVGKEEFNDKTITVEGDEEIGEIYSKIFNLVADNSSTTEVFKPTFDYGVKYKMPFYQRLSAGLHGSYATGRFAYSDVRFGLTLTPVNAISIAATAGKTTYGGALGVALNLRLGPLNVFGGVDGLLTNFTPQGLPVNPLNTVAKLGVTIAVRE